MNNPSFWSGFLASFILYPLIIIVISTNNMINIRFINGCYYYWFIRGFILDLLELSGKSCWNFFHRFSFFILLTVILRLVFSLFSWAFIISRSLQNCWKTFEYRSLSDIFYLLFWKTHFSFWFSNCGSYIFAHFIFVLIISNIWIFLIWVFALTRRIVFYLNNLTLIWSLMLIHYTAVFTMLLWNSNQRRIISSNGGRLKLLLGYNGISNALGITSVLNLCSTFLYQTHRLHHNLLVSVNSWLWVIFRLTIIAKTRLINWCIIFSSHFISLWNWRQIFVI